MSSLYALKYWYTRRLGFLIEASVRRGISPDVWTAVGVLAAALGAGAVVMGWWPAAFVLLAARLGGANLDGAVARARGVSRPFGFVLNEVGDRVSDLLIMAGLVGLALRTEPSPSTLAATLVAATAATLPTFVSLSAAGAGVPRLNGGPFGKTERCLAAVVAAALPQYLTVVAWAVVAGSLATAAVRLARTARTLRGACGLAPADRVAPTPPQDIASLGHQVAGSGDRASADGAGLRSAVPKAAASRPGPETPDPDLPDPDAPDRFTPDPDAGGRP